MSSAFTKFLVLLFDLRIFSWKKEKIKKPKNLFSFPQTQLDQYEARCLKEIHEFSVKGKGLGFRLSFKLPIFIPSNWFFGLRIQVIPRKNPSTRILYKVVKVLNADGECAIEVIPHNWYWRYLAWQNVKKREKNILAFCFISKNFRNEKYFCSEKNLEWLENLDLEELK